MADPGANFTSDNTAPASAAILDEILAANSGAAPSYGTDSYTEQLNEVAREVFDCDVGFYPVATGTAANALALAQVSRPFGACTVMNSPTSRRMNAAHRSFHGWSAAHPPALAGWQNTLGRADCRHSLCARHGYSSCAARLCQPFAGHRVGTVYAPLSDLSGK